MFNVAKKTYGLVVLKSEALETQECWKEVMRSGHLTQAELRVCWRGRKHYGIDQMFPV